MLLTQTDIIQWLSRLLWSRNCTWTLKQFSRTRCLLKLIESDSELLFSLIAKYCHSDMLGSMHAHMWPLTTCSDHLYSDLTGHGCGRWPPRPLPSASLQQQRGHTWHGHSSPFKRGLEPLAPPLQLRPGPLSWWKPLLCRGNGQRWAFFVSYMQPGPALGIGSIGKC